MEKLLEDNWIDIFNLLSSKDIENAADSCENWRNIITTNPLLYRKLTIYINIEDVKGKPWRKELPYKNLHLNRIFVQREGQRKSKINAFLHDIDHLRDVEKLSFAHSDCLAVVPILNKFTNITTLIAQRMNEWDKLEHDGTKINFLNLKYLRIDYDAIWLLSKIQNHKIEVFFATLCYYLTQKRVNEFGSFLQTCDKLKHLTLNGFHKEAIMQIKSQLETFEIIDLYTRLPLSLIQFLDSQKSSLKNLTLDVRRIDDQITNFVYFEMQLDKFVDGNFHAHEIQKLKKTTIKNLAITCASENFEFYEKLFQCCEMLEVVSVELPNVKQLEFLNLLTNLPKLKYLKVHRNYSKEELQQLEFKFNRLEKLILSDNCRKRFTPSECVKIIRCCPNLTHLKINVILTMNDFENIFEVCKNIQEIVLVSKIPSREFTNEHLEIFKSVGSKIKLKIETEDKDVLEKLKMCGAKNRLTVIEEIPYYLNFNLFEVCPRILNHVYYDSNDDVARDHFYIDDDY